MSDGNKTPIRGASAKKPKRFFDLTMKQFETLVVLARVMASGDHPSFEELARELGISVSSAHARVQALVAKGYVTYRGGHRGLSLTNRVGVFAEKGD
jgi:DNA-binding MarR family transcriptional regulator